LAFGTDGGGDYRTDPLALAAEVAWRRGVVVVSAGNGGEESVRLTNPAIDPYVIAVGAAETAGTRSVADDRVAPFSSRGDGTRNPDVVAPGRSIISARAPGSFVDNNYPHARVGERLLRGSGSSQAAAVVAGASALLLQQRPELTPDQVKAALVRTARPLPADPVTAQGAGLINVDAASGKRPATDAQAWEPAQGGGSIETARGSSHAHIGGQRIEGERDAWGRDFDSKGWASSSWSGSSWSGSSWSGSSWSGSSWSASSWTGSSWSGSSWTSTDWG
ncbi:MAG: serine protease AprX, partial [Actinomycetota bacterium]